MKYRWVGALSGILLAIAWIFVSQKSFSTTVGPEVCGLLIAQAVGGYWLGRQYGKVKDQAYHDSLTGVLVNRRFFELLESEIERAARHRYQVSLMFIDLDNFKKFNDQHGHLAGDKLLGQFAALLETTVRKHDMVGRWGGEEFVILLPHTNTEQALLVGERIRSSVRRERLGITVSIGLATFPDHAEDATKLAEYADHLMYEAKKEKDCMQAGPIPLILNEPM